MGNILSCVQTCVTEVQGCIEAVNEATDAAATAPKDETPFRNGPKDDAPHQNGFGAFAKDVAGLAPDDKNDVEPLPDPMAPEDPDAPCQKRKSKRKAWWSYRLNNVSVVGGVIMFNGYTHRRKRHKDKHSERDSGSHRSHKKAVKHKLIYDPEPLGERGSGIRSRGEVQDFEALKQACLSEGTLFEDPEFPAEDTSIFYSRSPPKPFEWRRPSELVDDPQFFVGGHSRFDIKQGELGDCWLLAAVANLTLNDTLFYQVVPQDQSFQDNYAGIFHFRFWQYGRWVDVVIDDRLPTYGGRLVFLHSEDTNEFWSALLEKAYAKLHGSYEALKGGTTMEAMEDFTGGVTELYEMSKAPPNLYKILLKAFERSSLLGCSIDPDPNILEAELPNGLIKGHAYSITCVREIEVNTPNTSGKIPMLRIRNPWGNEAEWKGAWSDKSREWSLIPDDEREAIGLTFESDGEFWMSFKDFVNNFEKIEICNLSPDSLDETETNGKTKWEMSMYEGAWVAGATAGGCRNNLDTFWMNPQYRIELTDPDDDDEDDKCTVIVGLMQKNRRAQRNLGMDCLTIGFAIYHLKEPESAPKPLNMDFFKYNASVARSPTFINMREVSCRFKLPQGTYCIVPSTFDKNEQGDFLLRVFSEKANHMEENEDEVGMTEPAEDIRQEVEEETDEERKVKEFFRTIAGEDLEIDWMELQKVLDFALKKGLEFEFEGFSKDICRSMVAMMDVDRSGKLGLEEFKTLWSSIKTWKVVFQEFDHDSSGSLNTFELRQALNRAGYRLNTQILTALVLRYGTQDGHITFDDFIMCAVKLKTMIETFKDYESGRNEATVTLEDWIEKTMYA
ncbi:unnamed protein product [Cyprideis torosa]|uniref:Uncharacterized protein n=1 Tax=Cyprideis torosa TaxID=163714 RepID=A0A7R8WCV7_9CRUS|nr:unnamed protein product [Cyprideis torosa]CAG0893965.1 unnamed protein product [Cyprideis torosa]